MRTPEIGFDSRTRALRRSILRSCARGAVNYWRRHRRRHRPLLALLLRLLHMRAALEANFVSEQLAIYLSVMAADIQRALRTRRVVSQQRTVEHLNRRRWRTWNCCL